MGDQLACANKKLVMMIRTLEGEIDLQVKKKKNEISFRDLEECMGHFQGVRALKKVLSFHRHRVVEMMGMKVIADRK